MRFHFLFALLLLIVFSSNMPSQAKTVLIGDYNCATESVVSYQYEEVNIDFLEATINGLDDEVSRLEISCVTIGQPLKIILNRPDLSIRMYRVYTSGINIQNSSLQSFIANEVYNGGIDLLISDSEFQTLGLNFHGFARQFFVRRNIIRTTLDINGSPPVKKKGDDAKNEADADEIKEPISITNFAVTRNRISNILEIKNVFLNTSIETRISEISGNSFLTLNIDHLKMNCSDCRKQPEIKIYRNKALDGIAIFNSEVIGNLDIAGSPFNFLEITNSRINNLNVLGQKIRDVFIRDTKEVRTSSIQNARFDDSTFGFFKMFNMDFGSLYCPNCNIDQNAYFSGDYDSIYLNGSSMNGALSFANVIFGSEETGLELFPSSINKVNLDTVKTPFIIFDKILENSGINIQWNNHQIDMMSFTEDVISPIKVAYSVAQNTKNTPTLMLVARFMDKKGQYPQSKSIREDISANRILESDEFIITKYMRWFFGYLIGFGYFYCRLIFVLVVLLFIGAFAYRNRVLEGPYQGYSSGFFYSLQKMLPGLNLDVRFNFHLATKRIRYYFYFLEIVGFISIGVILADISNAF